MLLYYKLGLTPLQKPRERELILCIIGPVLDKTMGLVSLLHVLF